MWVIDQQKMFESHLMYLFVYGFNSRIYVIVMVVYEMEKCLPVHLPIAIDHVLVN